jgi:hypothetical protein
MTKNQEELYRLSKKAGQNMAWWGELQSLGRRGFLR